MTHIVQSNLETSLILGDWSFRIKGAPNNKRGSAHTVLLVHTFSPSLWWLLVHRFMALLCSAVNMTLTYQPPTYQPQSSMETSLAYRSSFGIFYQLPQAIAKQNKIIDRSTGIPCMFKLSTTMNFKPAPIDHSTYTVLPCLHVPLHTVQFYTKNTQNFQTNIS